MGSVLKATYGIPDPTASHGGPFSYKTYLTKVMDKSFWVDEVVLWSVSMIWGLKIMVVNSKTLQEYHVHHDVAMRHMDVGLVYNASTHYTACSILYLYVWSLAVILQSLVFSVRQSNLVKDVTVCQDVHMSEYKVRHPDDSEDPPDVGLSSEDEASGMKETLGVAQRVTLLKPSPAQPTSTPSTSKHSRSTDPDVPEGYVKLADDEVVI